MLEFFIAALVIGIAPGPDNLFVLAQSATYGARLGFCIILGLCTGIAIHTCFLVAGVSALIAASPTAFFVIQCLGAVYLLYLAYKSFGVKVGTVDLDEGRSNTLPSPRKLYLRGVIMNLTNPKVILFILSLIPPAVRLDRPIHPSLQMAIFGAEFIVATMIVFGSIAVLAGSVKKYLLNSPKANRNLNWFSGCVFVLLAVALFMV
jgi:threonine/homoserine/homoserine lactone efflux protein